MKYFLIVSIFFNFIISACATKTDPEADPDAKIITSDKIILKAEFKPPSNSDKYTFVLLHGLGSDHKEWSNFADRLSQSGYGYLSVDLRGHGESIRTLSGKQIDMKYFGLQGHGSEWGKMVTDMDMIIKYLIKKKGIKKNTICFIGASLGANISLIYSAKKKFIPFVILLSPGWNYAGLMIEPAIKQYDNRPLLICASPGDQYAYISCSRLLNMVKSKGLPVTFYEGKNKQHGVQMFDGVFENKIIDWIKTK